MSIDGAFKSYDWFLGMDCFSNLIGDFETPIIQMEVPLAANSIP
jgi:hypothetical protein